MSPVEVLASQLRPDRGWKEHLSEEFRQPYMQGLAEFLAAEEQAGKVLFPASQHCFNALNSTPLENVRVVILGHDLGIAPPDHGCLQPWAEQGVLLLNSVLTVVQGQAGAHQGRGWETFTDKVIETINREREGVVFLLWGSYAKKKGQHIDRTKHLVLDGPHPSPLSAYRGFFGCKHFSKANDWLQRQGKPTVNWALPSKAELIERYKKS